MIDLPSETQHQQPVRARGSNPRAITVARSQHGSAGFTNLMVNKHDGTIVLDPHGTDSCVITLDETATDCPVRPAREMARMNAPPPQRAIHSLVEPRPGYGATIEAQPITNTSPNIQAGTRVACRTNWEVTTLTPSPQPFLTHLTTTVKQLHTTRSVLRHIIALADNSTTLSNEELRDRLTTLTDALTKACAR